VPYEPQAADNYRFGPPMNADNGKRAQKVYSKTSAAPFFFIGVHLRTKSAVICGLPFFCGVGGVSAFGVVTVDPSSLRSSE
jgi:hypothetical protein